MLCYISILVKHSGCPYPTFVLNNSKSSKPLSKLPILLILSISTASSEITASLHCSPFHEEGALARGPAPSYWSQFDSSPCKQRWTVHAAPLGRRSRKAIGKEVGYRHNFRRCRIRPTLSIRYLFSLSFQEGFYLFIAVVPQPIVSDNPLWVTGPQNREISILITFWSLVGIVHVNILFTLGVLEGYS